MPYEVYFFSCTPSGKYIYLVKNSSGGDVAKIELVQAIGQERFTVVMNWADDFAEDLEQEFVQYKRECIIAASRDVLRRKGIKSIPLIDGPEHITGEEDQTELKLFIFKNQNEKGFVCSTEINAVNDTSAVGRSSGEALGNWIISNSSRTMGDEIHANFVVEILFDEEN